MFTVRDKSRNMKWKWRNIIKLYSESFERAANAIRSRAGEMIPEVGGLGPGGP